MLVAGVVGVRSAPAGEGLAVLFAFRSRRAALAGLDEGPLGIAGLPIDAMVIIGHRRSLPLPERDQATVHVVVHPLHPGLHLVDEPGVLEVLRRLLSLATAY